MARHPLNAYLTAGRLADVLTLIQVLAYDESAKRTNEGLVTQLQRKPITSDTWVKLGNQHAEFFRVFQHEDANDKKESVTLLARFVLKPLVRPDGERVTPPLSAEVTGHLMDLAIQLHDREIQKRDRWKTVLAPMLAAFIAAAAAISAAFIPTVRRPPPCQPIQGAEQTKTP